MTSEEEFSDPFTEGLRTAAPSVLFATPSAEEAGKSSGGGFLGKGASEVGDEYTVTSTVNKEEVRIVSLREKDFVSKFCGGLIGRAGNRACLAEHCDVQSHKVKRLELPNESAYLFICVKDQAAVYTKPYISPDALEPHLERYLAETRSVPAWETLFRSIALQPVADRKPVEVERLVKRIDEDKVEYGVTPLKKRARFKSDTSAMEAGFDLPMPVVDESLDPASIAFPAEFPIQWQALVKTIKLLSRVTESVRNQVLEVVQTTDEELDGQAYNVAKLANLVGHRPAQWGTMTVFDCLRTANLDLDAFTQKVNPDRLEALETLLQNHHPSTQAEFKKQMFSQMTNSLAPVFQLFNGLSSNVNSPGDILAKEFQKIQQELNALKQAANVPNKTNNPQHPWSLGVSQPQGSMPNPSLNVPAGGTSADLQARLMALEEQVKAVEVQLESNRVEMAGEVFRSRDEVKAWLQAEANQPGDFVYFVDAHSLLGLATEHVSSNTEVIQFQMSANRTGYGSSDEAIVISGFRLELPTFFGKDGSVNEASKDTRILPGVKDFDAWDPPGGHSGARKRMDRQVGAQQKQMNTSAGHYLKVTAMIVAKEMINQSARFLLSLGTWVSQHFIELTGKGGDEDNAWKLISHSVRAIFADLHMARMAGRGPFPKGTDEVTKASGVIWGSLQAHLKMAEYLEAGFTSHPRLSHILNVHLQEHAVLKHELVDLVERIENAEKAAEKAQSTADSAKNLAKKK